MSDEPVPRLRVVDGGGGRSAAPTPAVPEPGAAFSAAAADATTPLATKGIGWFGILLFLVGALAGGAAVPMLLGHFAK